MDDLSSLPEEGTGAAEPDRVGPDFLLPQTGIGEAGSHGHLVGD